MSEMFAFINEHFPNHCAMKWLPKLNGKQEWKRYQFRSPGELKNERVAE